MKKKPNDRTKIDGLSVRHVGAIVRRKMLTKSHGDKTKYKRTNTYKPIQEVEDHEFIEDLKTARPYSLEEGTKNKH